MNFLFNKKKSIAPLLEDFVDIHCHVLPGLDDGAKNMHDTHAMLSAYKKLGFRKIIATPHILKGSYPNTQETIMAAFDRVSSEMDKELNIISNASAEHMLDEDFEQLLKKNELLCIQDRYVLIEMSYFQKPANVKEIIFKMEHQGYVPILAHPERYHFIKKIEEFQDFKKIGCLFQLNLLSLTSHYGAHVQKKAEMLLKHDMYDFTATDAHHEGHLNKTAKIAVSKKKYSKLSEIIDRTNDKFPLNY